jgi:hypothetical protein
MSVSTLFLKFLIKHKAKVVPKAERMGLLNNDPNVGISKIESS